MKDKWAKAGRGRIFALFCKALTYGRIGAGTVPWLRAAEDRGWELQSDNLTVIRARNTPPDRDRHVGTLLDDVADGLRID